MSDNSRITITAIRTDLFKRGEDLLGFLTLQLKGRLREGSVLAITSKVVSVSEDRFVEKSAIESKRVLVQREADIYFGEGGHGIDLSIKHGLLIPSAGIDESNSETDGYILYPENPYRSAEKIWHHLRKAFDIQKLGIILTDSHTMPLRRGVTGIALSHWGLKATRSLVGAPDLFGKKLKYTSVDVVDSLAAMAVFSMGEAEERRPLAVIDGADVKFTDRSSPEEIVISPAEDLYFPLLRKSLPDLAEK